MAEKEYIEREAFLDAIERMKPYHQDADDIAEMLQNFPAADVRPVKRGKWATVYDDFMKSNYDTCSRCGKEYFGANGFNFCPNCGADMGGEKLMARRKPRPSMPYWFWLWQDGCWFCKNRNNCNQCKANREYAKERLPKKYKGYRGEPPKEE